MSIVNNIQGSLTQVQQPQQIQQQHSDQTRVQQTVGEQQAIKERDTKQTTINQQEDVGFTQVSKDGKSSEEQKGKKKKKTLFQETEASDESAKIASIWGGGLIDTQA